MQQLKKGQVFFSNCLAYALARWWLDGGYVIMRKSHYGWWPHFLWSKDLKRFVEFQPIEPNHHLRFPPTRYKGAVREWSVDGEQPQDS